MSPRFLTIREVAEILPVSLSGVYHEVHAGRLACIKVGGKYIVPALAVAVLEARVTGSEAPSVRPLSSPSGRPFLSVAQAAKHLRVSGEVLGREVRLGRFPAHLFAGRYIVPCKAIDDIEVEAVTSMTLVDVAEYVVVGSRLCG